MARSPWRAVLIAAVLTISIAGAAMAQKSGGILRIFLPDSPASMSSHEETTVYSIGPMLSVFNNLILFDQSVKQNSLDSIRPDLATAWSWNDDRTALTFTLRDGVRWHDGAPFSARDVVCTWDLLLETSESRFRANPRRSVFSNLDRVTTNGALEVTFHLKRPQPAFPMLLAGYTGVIYPCHVPPAQMRRHPIGTGPFKFQEFRPNELIKVTKNTGYWLPGRPYLDGIEYPIIRNIATAVLAFVSGKIDMTFPFEITMPLLKDLRTQAPGAICDVTPGGGTNRHLIINRAGPPFDNPEVRLAMALSLDRQAFIDIIAEGKGEIGGVLQPTPGGVWGMPPEKLRELPGYDPDIQKNRARGRQIMEKLGYGPNNRLKIRMMARDLATYRVPAVIAIDQLKEVYIDADLDTVDTAIYYPRIVKRDFTIGLNLQISGPDPDPVLALFYGCGSNLNWDGYCNAGIDAMIERQSREIDPTRRRDMVWAIERRLAEETVRPILFYADAGTCWQPHVKGVSMMVNSSFNGHRRDDIWLDNQPPPKAGSPQ